MDTPRLASLLFGGTFFAALSAASAAPWQTGSAVGPVTASISLAGANASGSGQVPEDTDEDKTMLPEGAGKDRSTLPETATGAEPAASPESPAAPGAAAADAAARQAAIDGCWARLYDAENFIGRSVTLSGPSEMPDMQGSFRSIEVGPYATVITFGDEDFANESARFNAGERAANLREPGLSDDFESLRLTCSLPAPRIAR
jgi:hypothetical protein